MEENVTVRSLLSNTLRYLDSTAFSSDCNTSSIPVSSPEVQPECGYYEDTTALADDANQAAYWDGANNWLKASNWKWPANGNCGYTKAADSAAVACNMRAL